MCTPCLLQQTLPTRQADILSGPYRALAHFAACSFRQLLPLLEQAEVPTWAVDLIGWGFTDSGAARRPDMQLGPQQKREHLFSFWQAKVPMHHCGPTSTLPCSVAASKSGPDACKSACDRRLNARCMPACEQHLTVLATEPGWQPA